LAARAIIETAGEVVDLLAIDDRVAAKKRSLTRTGGWSEDWSGRTTLQAKVAQPRSGLKVWLRELRRPELLIEAASANPETASRIGLERPTVQAALRKNQLDFARALEEEEHEQRRKDRAYGSR
jgi:hypothetical protein